MVNSTEVHRQSDVGPIELRVPPTVADNEKGEYICVIHPHLLDQLCSVSRCSADHAQPFLPARHSEQVLQGLNVHHHNC